MAKHVAYLLLTQQPQVWFSAFPWICIFVLLTFIEGTASNIGQRPDNVNRTHLVLDSGKLVLQKTSKLKSIFLSTLLQAGRLRAGLPLGFRRRLRDPLLLAVGDLQQLRDSLCPGPEQLNCNKDFRYRPFEVKSLQTLELPNDLIGQRYILHWNSF